jgi:hypothetical protein
MWFYAPELVDFLQLQCHQELIVRIQIERTLIHPSGHHDSELSPGVLVIATEAPSVAAAVETYLLGASVELLDEVQYPTPASAVAAVRKTDSVFMLRFTVETEPGERNEKSAELRQRRRARRADPDPIGDERSSVA